MASAPQIEIAQAESPMAATTMEITDAVRLSQQETVEVVVPLYPGEKPRPVQAQVCGIIYTFLPGVRKEAPKEVYLVLVRAGLVTPYPEDFHEHPAYQEIDPMIADAVAGAEGRGAKLG